MTNYNCVKITAEADENIVPLIFEKLTGNIPKGSKCMLKFVGFEDDVDTEFKINNAPNVVPSSGYFITPYDGNNYLPVTQLSFNAKKENFKIWFIF